MSNTPAKPWAEMSPAERRAWAGAGGVSRPESTIPVRVVLASGQSTTDAGVSKPYAAGALQWSAPANQATECCLMVGGGESGGSLKPLWFPAQQGDEVLAIELEYGSGNVKQRLLMDVRTGTYQLPTCSYVRASIVQKNLAGVPGVTAAIRVPMALVQGLASDANDAQYTIAGMTDGVYAFPAFARNVELLQPGRIVYNGIYSGTQVRIIQETTSPSPLVSPPWSPVDLTDTLAESGQTFTWTNEPTAALLGMCSFGVGL